MISDQQRDQAARELLAAEASGVAMGRLSDAYPGLQIEDSYAIQQRVIAHKIAAGAQLVGHKIGLTSRAMQEASGIDEPDFGHILDSHVLDANEPIDLARFQVPRVEVELAFILGADLDRPNPTVADVLRATAYVQPAIEIIDSRTVIPRKVTDTIADNSALGAIVLGGSPVAPSSIDLSWVGAVLYRNGVPEESGVSAAVLGHPAQGIVWLARRLKPFGTILKAGQIVLAGSFTRLVAVSPGDSVVVHYGPLGLIPLQFKK